jgi:SAM-dependent methyltransferase
VEPRQWVVGRVRAQFRRPRGPAGRIAGWIMAHRSSNRRRNVWAVSLLDVQRDDRVLEVGFGPGIAIAELSRIATEGCVCGVDHSELMLRQAAKRNAEGIRRGRVDLRLGSIENPPAFEEPFDKILAVNALPLWDRAVERLEELQRLLRAGGRIAIAFQPRGPGATDEAAAATGQAIAAALGEAGFYEVRLETLRLRPAVLCALGEKAQGGGPDGA